MNSNWFKKIEYTPEVVKKLRVQMQNCGLGYITTEGIIEFDKAIRSQLRNV